MRVISLISLAVKLASCLSLSFSLVFALFFGHFSLTCLQFGADEQSCRGDLMLCSQTQRHHSASSMSLSLSHSLSSVLCSLTHSVTRSISLSLSLGVRRGKLQILICEKEDAEKSQERRVAMAMGMGFLFVCMWEEIERECENANLTRDSSNIHL